MKKKTQRPTEAQIRQWEKDHAADQDGGEDLGPEPTPIRTAVRDEPEPPVTQPAPRKLVDDAHLAVPLITLDPGTPFKTPDSPRDNLPGTFGTLLYVNPSRARVKLESGTRTFTGKRRNKKEGTTEDVEVTVAKSGETDFAANTMVIPVKEEK